MSSRSSRSYCSSSSAATASTYPRTPPTSFLRRNRSPWRPIPTQERWGVVAEDGELAVGIVAGCARARRLPTALPVSLDRPDALRARTGRCRPCAPRRWCSGRCRCGVSDENTTTPPAGTSSGDRTRRDPRRRTPSRAGRRSGAGGCRAVQPGEHPRAAVLDGGVGERDPAREVLLRLDERVAVVLVPREPARLLGLLVDGLVPVEVHVGTEEVVAEADEAGVAGEAPCRLRAEHRVQGEGDRAGLRDVEAAVVLRGEEARPPAASRASRSAARLRDGWSASTTSGSTR